eukprot:TRINITY_DN5484_c0_g1_i1.p1 TRINITY_DN5484_c0_g1~~TRINITY_DN5484_c0_g1_i1.p1  ORF type:complete len:225 (-),score=72.14 TRINITY_DN5484_c0_g1_i1:40-714(-)
MCVEVEMLIAGAVVGTFVAFSRLGIVLLFSCVSMMRMDVSLLPPGFRTFDGAANSFYAVALLDHRVNNPVMRSFLLLAANRHYPRPVDKQGGLLTQVRRFWRQRLGKGDSGERQRLLDGADEAAPVSCMADIDAATEASRRRQLIRNRFWLFVLLAKNPGLCVYRRASGTARQSMLTRLSKKIGVLVRTVKDKKSAAAVHVRDELERDEQADTELDERDHHEAR